MIAIAKNLNVSIPEELISIGVEDETLDNEETLRKEIVAENCRYIVKIELGKMISSIIDENDIINNP